MLPVMKEIYTKLYYILPSKYSYLKVARHSFGEAMEMTGHPADDETTAP